MSKLLFPFVIVVLAAVIVQFFRADSGRQPAYLASSTDVRGVSLLYDTLRHMGYPVGVSRSRLTASTSTDLAYIIIQPFYPPSFSEDEIAIKLDWVRRGGLLIFLQDPPRRVIWPTDGYNYTQFGNLSLYEVGDGMLVTGGATDVTNRRLMYEYNMGARIHAIIDRWQPQRLMFGEYYHGPRPSQNLFAHLPPVVRLVVVQLGILAVIILWYVGKRFGNPVPYYEESEREENEHVRALARLYMKVRRKPR